jgi:hypothetical protein
MSQTEPFDIVPFWVMANSNVFIAICSYDVPLVLRERHCGEEGCVPQNKCAVRGVVMSNKRFTAFKRVLRFWWWWGDVSGFHWIPTNIPNEKVRISERNIHTKTRLQIYRQQRSLFRQKLYKLQSLFWADSWLNGITVKLWIEYLQRIVYLELRHLRPLTSQTFSSLSSLTVTNFRPAASSAAQEIGWCDPVGSKSDTVECSASPELRECR